jgi:hypothetical protein
MKACKHFRRPYGTTYINPSEHGPSGWLEVYTGKERVISEFRPKLYWNYLNHLLNYPDCRREAGVELSDVRKALRIIHEEYGYPLPRASSH